MTVTTQNLNKEAIELIRKTVCSGASDSELALFLHVCQKTGLDPLTRQIYSIERKSKHGPSTRTIQTGIDGLRSIAERTGMYAPGKETVFVYDEKNRLISATAYVKKMTPDGTWHEVGSTAFFAEYVQSSGLWGRMPTVMLAKCAESQCLRRCFPQEMCGLYSDDEMPPAIKDAEVEVVEDKVINFQKAVPGENDISEEQLSEIRAIIGNKNNNKKLISMINEGLAKLGKSHTSQLKPSEFEQFKFDLANWINLLE